ncbi:hypothetical protein AB0E81_11095 [Streptomyces sp. NPDC033538]|uniref:hypothetical protein n=1 Tax=Streptomyces sp. NPDC033538 TaxID=3155367 RepID=UPI0033E87733
MNAIHVTINGRTYAPRTHNALAIAGALVDFRDPATRSDALTRIGRIYGVDARRAFQIGRHFKNESIRRYNERRDAGLRGARIVA